MFHYDTLSRLTKFIMRETSYKAYTQRPDDATKRKVGILVQRIGTWDTGENLPEIDRPVINMWCCAKTIGEAYKMADALSIAMERFKYEPHVYYCEQYAAYEDSGPVIGPALKLSYRMTFR